jgi:hypothetical protein
MWWGGSRYGTCHDEKNDKTLTNGFSKIEGVHSYSFQLRLGGFLGTLPPKAVFFWNFNREYVL